MYNLHQELLTDKPNSQPGRNMFKPNGLDVHQVAVENKITAEVFLDPLCPFSWLAEPALRQLERTFSGEIRWIYRTPGWIVSWEQNTYPGFTVPADVGAACETLSTPSGMPMDGRVWLDDPPHSSFPPSIAFRAACLQNKDVALRFLRRMREMLFVEGKNISRWRTIKQAALEVGLDIDILLLQYNNGDGLKSFVRDQTRARELGIAEFPSIHLSNGERFATIALRSESEQSFNMFKSFVPAVEKVDELDIVACLKRYPTLTPGEAEKFTGRDWTSIRSVLQDMERRGVVFSFGKGRLWSLNP